MVGLAEIDLTKCFTVAVICCQNLVVGRNQNRRAIVALQHCLQGTGFIAREGITGDKVHSHIVIIDINDVNNDL